MAAVRSALIIANDEYQDPKLRKLRAPSQDAEELGRVLRDPGIGDFDVEVSTNEPEHIVRRKIATFFADRRREDLLLLHISSHGLKDDSGRLYFAASDTEVDHLDATAVWAEFVNRQMTGSRSQRIVLLLDCCYSGAFARGMTARAGEAVEVRERFEGSGRAVLTASSAMEYSFEGDELSGEGSPSVFTSAVVKALETGEADRDGDHLISVDELYDYVHDQVREITPKQTPGKWVFDLRGDLYIAKSRYSGGEREGDLPGELEVASESPLAYVREGAVHELGRLLRGGRAGLAEAARAVLERLVEDDSRRVSEAAKATLASAAPPASPEHETPRRLADPPTAALARPTRRPRVRLVAALLAVALAAAVLGIAGVFGGGGKDDAALPTGVAPVLGRLSSPWALAVGAGSLWVADYDGDAIRRVDPRSRKVEGKPITVGDGPTAIAVADGVVWVVNDNDGFVSKVDAASGAVVGKEIRIPNGTRAGDTIAAGEGKVWVADGKGTIVPINAADGKREPGIALPGRAKALEVAFGKGVLWILADDGTVMQMDASSRTPRDPVKVAARLAPDTGQLAVGEGAVWVAALDEGTVVRVDPAKQTHVPIPFPDGIDGDIAAGAGYVWVIDGARRLVQIDPSTNSVRSGSAGRFAPTYSGTTNDMTAGEGALWIADLGRDRVIRVVP